MIRSLYFIKKHDNAAVDPQKLKNIHKSESDFSSSIDLSKESSDMKKEKNKNTQSCPSIYHTIKFN